MKKIFFLGASALAVATFAPVAAQDAIGVAPRDAAPLACGPADNCSIIDQDGDNLQAVVNQTGSGGVSVIEQERLPADNNRGPNKANVAQDGSSSDSRISQSGDRLEADVDQTGASYSEIAQQGRTQAAKVEQIGGGNASFIDQAGNSNSVGDPGKADYDVKPTSAGVYQNGADNLSVVDQNATTYTNAQIAQIGSENESFVRQEARGNPGNDFGGSIDLLQSGTSHYSSIEQISDINPSLLRAKVDQFGADGESTITQSGSSNLATVMQDSGLASVGSNSTITQSGDGQIADVSQTGSFHVSTIIQAGFDNEATVTQTGNNHMSAVDQDGTGNLATVNQGNM